MDHSKLVLAQAFGSQSEADLAKSMLESAGIDAMVQADTAGGMRPHIAWSGLGFRVLVREEDVAENLGRSRQYAAARSEEHTSELQSHSDLVCRLLLEKKKH